MYLFGFPPGVAGGSKETEYSSFFNTSHDTSKSTAIGNTSWGTNKTTSRSTSVGVNYYTSGLGKNLYHSTQCYITIHDRSYMNWNGWLDRAQLSCVWRYCYTITSSGQPYGSVQSTSSGEWVFDCSFPGKGNPEDNVGKVYNFAVIGPFVESYTYSSKIYWKYKFYPNPSQTAYQIKNIIDPSIAPTTSYSNRNTSFGTYSHNTSQITYTNTMKPTTYQTSQLTSHITYG